MTGLDLDKLKEAEYREISFDWRHRDAMLWQTLAVAIVFSSVIFSSWGDAKYTWPIKIVITLIAIITNFILLVKIVKDNYYQFGSSELLRKLGQEKFIASLYPNFNPKSKERLRGNTRIWRPDTSTLKEFGNKRIPLFKLYLWLSHQSAFKWYFYFLVSLTIISIILCLISILCVFSPCKTVCLSVNNSTLCS